LEGGSPQCEEQPKDEVKDEDVIATGVLASLWESLGMKISSGPASGPGGVKTAKTPVQSKMWGLFAGMGFAAGAFFVGSWLQRVRSSGASAVSSTEDQGMTLLGERDVLDAEAGDIDMMAVE